MNHPFDKHSTCFVLTFVLTSFFIGNPAGTSAADYDYSHRMRQCEITLVSMDGIPVPQAMVGIAQISNDFVFGGTIRGDGFDTLGENYGEKFLSYFDIGIPENELKWENVMKCSQKCNPDFSKADAIVNWLLEKRISIGGHRLFSNEKTDYIPEWTRSLGTAEFKQAMQDRIDSTMGRFKGKVTQWDLINEICHGESGTLLSSSMLESKSGDPNIISWIMDEARKKDSLSHFVINDYGLITSGDQAAIDQFVSKVKPLSSKFDLVGASTHFGANLDKSSYEPKINYLAEQLGKPVCLTDVDFSSDISQAPDKIEELMRTCFANPKVKGITMGSWCRRFMPGNLTSYFVDSLGNETPVGTRWNEVRSGWKSSSGALFTDDSGRISFTGYQGKYQALISTVLDTFFLEPGEGIKKVTVVFRQGTGVKNASAGLKTIEISFNGISALVKLPANSNAQLFLCTYSLSGQLLSRTTVSMAGGKHRVTIASSSGCRVFRIETADRLPLYAGKISTAR